MSELNDKELFDNAIADTPVDTPADVVETPQIVDEPANEGRVRDPETGRFAKAETPEPVTEAPQPAEAPKAEPDSAAHVPSWRLREVNDAKEAAERRYQDELSARRNLERQIAELRQQNQPKPEPVDFFTDPNAAFRQNIDPVRRDFQKALEAQRNQFSEMMARQAHGDTKIEEVMKWVQTRMDDPSLEARIQRSSHPWGDLVKSYDEHKTLSEIGTDPSAYVQKKLDDALNDPAFLAKALERAKAQASGQIPGTKPNTLVQLPPSINRATSSGSPHDDSGDLSDGSLYANAIR